MNPFYYIKELRDTTESLLKAVKDTTAYMTAEQHYKEMLNMLDLLSTEMQEAEYHYEVESVKHHVKVFDEMTVLQKELTEDVLIFQPIAIGEAELSAIDMQSLAEVLTKLRDDGMIKENILLLPPNINVFRAKLAKGKDDKEEFEEELPFN